MAIEGPLRELALTDVFQLLDLSRKTGVLTVRHEGREQAAVIRFERGGVVSAELPESTSQLGHLLLRAGKVTERGIERARREQRQQPDRQLGSLLVELGFASEDDVRKQLRFQIEQTIYELIRWKDGYFRFEEGKPVEPGLLSVRVPTESLLMEAARRIDEWTTLEPKVPHMSVVPRLLGDGDTGPTLDLHPNEWEVLAEIDGERTLKKIATELGRSDFDVAKIVFGLVSTGVVEILEPEDEALAGVIGRAGIAGALNEVEQAVRTRHFARAQALLGELGRQHPQDAHVPLWHGRLLVASDRWPEAVAAFARAVQLDPLLADAHYHLGFAAARSGDLARAEEAWTTYLRLPDTALRLRAVVSDGLGALAALNRVLHQEEL
jgi:hypothetical protein